MHARQHSELEPPIAGTHECGYNGDGIPAASAKLSYPPGVIEDSRGRVFIADSSNNRIRVVDAPSPDVAPERMSGLAKGAGDAAAA